MRSISPQDLHARLALGDVRLLDVRMPEEVEAASIAGAQLIPLHELPVRFGEIATDKPLVALCHHGVRSQTAARFLEKNGYAEVLSLDGGIDAWSQQVDASVPRY